MSSFRKNKKGFTLVELVCVVAIMGILAVVIGGLLSAASTAYLREKEVSSAKDISSIIEKEIARVIKDSSKVCLSGEGSNHHLTIPELPTISYWKVTYIFGSDYAFSNYVFKSYSDCSMFYARYVDSGSDNDDVTRDTRGYLRYYKKGTSGIINWTYATDYFAGGATSEDAIDTTIRKAFYGNSKIELFFKAVFNANDKPVGVTIFCDVYNSKNVKKYDSPGTTVQFLKAIDSKQTFVMRGEIQYGDNSETGLINSDYMTVDKTKKVAVYYDFMDKDQKDVNGDPVLDKDREYYAIYFA